jgi:preprotein translocase subunit SecE
VAGRSDKPKRENAIRRFFRETIGELRRVTWPTWPEARRLTIITIVVLVLMAAFLGTIDWGASNLLKVMLGV